MSASRTHSSSTSFQQYRPKKAGDDANEAELIRAAAPELPLPPVVRTARAEGHLPIFQLFYSLQTVQE